MKLSRELWLRLEPMLGVALEMDAVSRTPWLAALDASHPDLAPLLRRMLERHERAERSGEMETVPSIPPSPPTASAHAAGERVGPFRLLRQVGRGGMGEVWLAEQADGRVERQVALKLPALHLQGSVAETRFRQERNILAKLVHPNIARLYDAGVSEAGQPYLAMEFVEGETLIDRARAHPTGMGERLRLFRQVLAATAHAHRHLVVHRDLKPANILIDQSGQVKLLDFGIAKLLDDEDAATASRDLTRLGGRVMTLRYAAPEQVAGEAITTTTDIYSLGVILHELVTEASPHRAAREGRPLTDAMLLADETTVPSSHASPALAPLVRGDLDAIILKAMRRDPRDRYASVELLDEDIARHLERRPVKARAGTWRYLAGRFVARHKLPIATATAVLVTLAAGLVMVEHERRVAVAERERATRHFASVRRLANSLMFDIHGEIESVPGTLKAREMLVRTALQYLDSLAGEAANDPALAFEVAVAYRKIGDILGEPGGANTGDLSTARANYEKGMHLFVALEALRPDDVEVLRERERLGNALAKSYALIADPRWRARMAEDAQLARRIASLPGATSGDRARETIVLAEQAQLTGLRLGRDRGVESAMDQAVEKVEALARERPDDLVVLEAKASVYGRAANAYTYGKRTRESVRQSVDFNRKALAAAESILAGKPENEHWLKFRAATLVDLAKTLNHAGENAEADRTIAEALAQNARLYARDPKNVELGIARLVTLENASVAAYRVGDMPRTLRLAREALAQESRLPGSARGTITTRAHVAESKALIGGALLSMASAPALGRDKRLAMLVEARPLLAEAVAFLEEVSRLKLGALDESYIREIKDAARHCDEAIAKLSR
ncbi:MAG: serine/threonine-protein kinase [Burkholderiales bacterium]